MGDNTRYSLADAAMGAFSVFFTQSPSFLDAQRTLQVKKGCNNTHTLFGMTQIPSDNHIRNLLDPVPPHELFPVFSSLVDGLNTAGHLEVYRSINGDLLVALDGTQYFPLKGLPRHSINMRIERGHPKVINIPEFYTPGKILRKQKLQPAPMREANRFHAGRN